MTWQLVVTHSIHPTEIPPFLDGWVTMLCPQTIVCAYIYVKKQAKVLVG